MLSNVLFSGDDFSKENNKILSVTTISIAPGYSIQKAINTAPGTSSIIVLDPGTYTENIILRSGITITSVNKHKAIIKPKNNSKYTINGWGVSNIVVSNLTIDGGIEIGQVTSDFSRVSNEILIKNNNIVNCENHDGIHLGGVTNATIEGNTISGAVSQQGIDFVGVRDSKVFNNVVCNIHNSSGMGIVVKAGSNNVEISQNEIYKCGNAAIACGQVSDEIWIWPDGLKNKYEARNIKISENNIHDNEKYSIMAMGAMDCHIFKNSFGESKYYAAMIIKSSSETHSPSWPSQNIVIHQNSLLRNKLDVEPGQLYVLFNEKPAQHGDATESATNDISATPPSRPQAR